MRATLTPAYGRDYKNATEAKADLIEHQKDFILHTINKTGVINISELRGMGYKQANIRYSNQTRITTAVI